MFVSVDTVFLLLIVGNILFIAAGYVAYPKWFKSHTLIYFKNFLKALPFMALFHLLLMLSGDIEVNPGPKSKTNQRTAKSRFMSDLNADASLVHSDPKELATKYVNVRTVQRWLRDCLPLRFTSCNPFFDKPELLLERDKLLCEKYDVHIRSIRRWKHDYQHSRFACSVDMDNADNDELAKKYGVRTATINIGKLLASACSASSIRRHRARAAVFNKRILRS